MNQTNKSILCSSKSKHFYSNAYQTIEKNTIDPKISDKNIKLKLLNVSGLNSTENSPNTFSNTIFSTNRFNLKIPNFKNVVAGNPLNAPMRNRSSSTFRMQKNSADETKIIYSKFSQADLNKTQSVESSNHSLDDEKKEEIMKTIYLQKSTTKKINLEDLKETNYGEDVEKFHKKLFDRKIRSKFDQNKVDVTQKPYLEYIDNKVDSMKNKIILMKGVFDYVYPKIVLKKAEEITNAFRHLKEKEHPKILPKSLKKENNQFVDNFPFQIQHFKTSNRTTTTNKEKETNQSKITKVPVKQHSKREINKVDAKNEKIISPFKIKSFC
jgi:hypothetical protein